MNSSVFSFLSDFVFLLLLFIQIPSSLSNDDLFTACSNQFVCGNISAFFPFWGAGRPPSCGIHELELKCENDIAKMNINQVAYRVLKINHEDEILRIAREDYLAGLCPPQFPNSTFNPKILKPSYSNENFTLIYGCEDAPITIPGSRTFNCKIKDVDGQTGYIKEGDHGPGECNGSVIVPFSIPDFPPDFPRGLNTSDLEKQLKKGFEVKWKVDMGLCWECATSSGVCGIDNDTNQTTCYCPNQSSGSKTCALPAPTTIPAPTPIPAPGSTKRTLRRWIVVGSSVVAATIITSFMIIICLTRRKGPFSTVIAMTFRLKNSQHVDSVETFMMDYHSLTPKRFSYSDIKKMTNSFFAQELYSSTASSLPCESSQEGRVYKLSTDEGDLSLEIANFM
ncbi:hypothetical protein OIU84_028717 [Salix udensis]|uniref:non-specific serine/threonine protein kinase n=1 Tax=Salix udensis TaxID=889485 RepID=A0AAD6KDT5_9ROSI|nr:hypothetical protein OIU84_028717 [Salix udensis]